MRDLLTCDICGSSEVSVVADGLGKCDKCGAYVDFEYDDTLTVEKIRRADKEKEDKSHFVNEDMWYGMLRGWR
jgi:ribosomal protein L37AE/L43A